jgi:hypothetical protein
MTGITVFNRDAHIAVLLALVVCLVWPASGSARGSEADVSDIKAAFLLNFARFAEWPDLGTADSIAFCIIDDAQVGASLRRLGRHQKVQAHAIEVRTLDDTPGVDAQGCHVLYVSNDAPDASRVAASIGGTATLTVSDAAQFASHGGMIELFIEGNRMRFAINVGTLQRSRLRLAAQLLGLAKIVKDDDAH